MKKDKTWLKEEIEEDIKSWGGGNPDYFRGASDAYENVKDWLNQLDEPEVLSSDWIKDNQLMWTSMHGVEYYVPANKLYGKIVPKQEKEQKYNVKFKVKSSFGPVGIFLYKEGDEVLAGVNFRAYYPEEDEYRLTEQEIRDFQNGDILFEHFAVKAEELEE